MPGSSLNVRRLLPPVLTAGTVTGAARVTNSFSMIGLWPRVWPVAQVLWSCPEGDCRCSSVAIRLIGNQDLTRCLHGFHMDIFAQTCGRIGMRQVMCTDVYRHAYKHVYRHVCRQVSRYGLRHVYEACLKVCSKTCVSARR